MVELRPGRRPRIDMSQTLSVLGGGPGHPRHFLAEERTTARCVRETAGRPPFPLPVLGRYTPGRSRERCALVISPPPIPTAPRQRTCQWQRGANFGCSESLIEQTVL